MPLTVHPAPERSGFDQPSSPPISVQAAGQPIAGEAPEDTLPVTEEAETEEKKQPVPADTGGLFGIQSEELLLLGLILLLTQEGNGDESGAVLYLLLLLLAK